jgi:predicted nucleic acid-binding protein
MNVADLDGTFFLDTNILVYSFDHGEEKKRNQARDIVRGSLVSGRGIVGTQVVQEFLNVALRKFSRPMGTTEAREYLRGVLTPLCQHVPNASTFDRALLIREETQYSWFDALIVTAAIESGCKWLLTEDMDDGRKLHGLTIRNPFT